MRNGFRLFLFLAAVPVALAAQQMNAAGSTFGNPIYQKWFSDYHQSHPNVEINYQSIGSGAGIHQLIVGTVDFGASDGPMTDAQLQQAPEPILHVPTVLGSVAPIYNLPGVSTQLRFTPQALAGIYLGHVTNWDDPAIARANPGVRLPSMPIVVVHRSDGSGTTYIWADYLAKVSPEWKSHVGVGTSISWPVGLGGKGSEGVAAQVRQMQGGFGYVELIYALQNHIQMGSVENSAGHFITASLASTTAAAASVKDMPADFRVSITDPPGANAYPIASFTWFLVPERWQDSAKRQAVVHFLNWMLDQGEAEATSLDYAPLPPAVAAQVRRSLRKIQ